MTVTKHKASRYWAVREADGALVCVYKCGAQEVTKRLAHRETQPQKETQPQQEAPQRPLRCPTTPSRRHPGWRTHERSKDP